jgi:cystathionine beta-synthase
MDYQNNVLGLVGHTPLVKLNRLNKGLKPLILAKMENLNPGFSVKDRIGVSMIDFAEREGLLKPGGTIVEATSGNTGIGLAIAAAVRGYKCIFVMTDKASVEKSRYLKALGADVVITPVSAKPGTPDHYVSTARRIAAETRIRFIPISIRIRQIRKRTIAPPGRSFGNKPGVRSLTLFPASERAVQSRAPDAF